MLFRYIILKSKCKNSFYYEKNAKGELKEIDVIYNRPNHWITNSIKNLVYTISTKKYQIKQSEIRNYGLFPVISQSSNDVEGFSDQEEKVCKIDNPIIIFGDHTRVIKIISDPFIVGADGVKIIVPIYSSTYFFELHLRHSIQFVKKRGYARHYSYFEKEFISLPPLAEQNRIVNKVNEIFEQLNILTL